MSYDPYSDPLNTLTGQPIASQAVADAFLGPALAGWIVQVVLWGAVCSNTLSYTGSAKYARDSRWTKNLMYLVVLLDTAVAGINIAELFYYGKSQKRDEMSLFLTLPMDGAPPALIGTTAVCVQGYLAHRAARLFQRRPTTRKIFLGVMGFLMLLAWMASAGSSALFLMYDNGTVWKAAPFTFNNLAGCWMWISASIDVIITLTLYFELRKHISGFNVTTDSLLRRLMRGAMKTAAYTSFLALVGAVCGVSFKIEQISTSDILMAFTSPLAGLYTLSFLYNLSQDHGSQSRGASLQYTAGPRAIAMQAAVGDGTPASISPSLMQGVQVQVDLNVMSEICEDELALDSRERGKRSISYA
ncbi:hypothetical protein T439DRAFT_325592 [Meredithblackwellia eburnea MCA 4105]